MIPSNIEREHIIKAIRDIDSNGILAGRESRSFLLIFEGKRYPPKYVLSLANKFANGEELDPSRFSGGQETNNFLKRLRFDIVEISSSRTIGKSISSPKRTFERTQKGHDERCTECKKTIEGMLKEIYGNVESNYKLEVSTNVEDYKDFPFYQKLKEILLELQKCRGHKDFVRTPTLSRCDFFVPNPGLIVEFDESQHFTSPRKMTLEHYPEKLKLGFDKKRWVVLCERINAKDNTPPYRDDQRAWYDTLRDFIPSIKGLNPTVRLYSKDLHWCSLNPQDSRDIDRFKNLIIKRKCKKEEDMAESKNDWIATVLIGSKDSFGKIDNDMRKKEIVKILNEIEKRTKGDGVILFPGGYLNTGEKKAEIIFESTSKYLKKKLEKLNRNIIICIGIDGCLGRGFPHPPKDQMATAVSKEGIIAIGRKFHPTPEEEKQIQAADSYQSLEYWKSRNLSRIFPLNGRRFFLAVCYDIFGIKQKSLPNPGVDIILNTVHQFTPKCKCKKEPCECGPASGDVYFARKGFTGASKQWNRAVFGSVAFLALQGKWRRYRRNILPNWPSGVYWNQGNKSPKDWCYKDNPIKPKDTFGVSIKEGRAEVRIYNIEVILKYYRHPNSR